MIETRKQAISAIEEIKRLTSWTDAEISRRAKVSRSTLCRLQKGNSPTATTRSGLYYCLLEARGLGDV